MSCYNITDEKQTNWDGDCMFTAIWESLTDVHKKYITQHIDNIILISGEKDTSDAAVTRAEQVAERAVDNAKKLILKLKEDVETATAEAAAATETEAEAAAAKAKSKAKSNAIKAVTQAAIEAVSVLKTKNYDLSRYNNHTYTYLRLLCHCYGFLYNISTKQDIGSYILGNNNQDYKTIVALSDTEEINIWGGEAEQHIITEFIRIQMPKNSIHIYVYELHNFNCFIQHRPMDHLIKKVHLIYLIRRDRDRSHYNYTLTKPEEVSVADDVAEKGDVGEDSVAVDVVVEKGDVKQSKAPNVAPMIVLSIFVLFMAAVSG